MSTITEAQVIEWLTAQLRGNNVKGRSLHYISICISCHLDDEACEKVWPTVYAQALDHEAARRAGSGRTFASALSNLDADIKRPPDAAKIAQKKRAEAARLLAEAATLDAITPSGSPVQHAA